MAPCAHAAIGTILFQEGIITVKSSPKDEASLKLPLLWNPAQSANERGTDKKALQARASVPLVLPNIFASQRSSNGSVTEALIDDVGQTCLVPCMPRKPKRQSNPSAWADVKKRPGRHLHVSAMSDQTMAEFHQAKSLAGGAVVCRYDEQGMEMAMKSAALRAKHRREVIQKASAAQRTRARKKGKVKQRSRHVEKIVISKATEPSHADDLHAWQVGDDVASRHSNSRPPSSEPATPRSSRNQPLQLAENSGTGTEKLQKLKLRSPKALRMNMLTKQRDIMKAEMKVRQRMEERQKEFELLPASEQEALERAYRCGIDAAARASFCSITAEAANMQLLSHYHPEAARVQGVHETQTRQLYNCLRELGLNGKKELEQKEIKLLCIDAQSNGELDFYGFCFELVPVVRSKLIELREEMLAEQFAYYDQDNNGFLDRDECSYMLTKLCRNMDRVGLEGVRNEFQAVFDRVKVVDPEKQPALSEYIDFEGFQILYERVNEAYECQLRDRVWKIVETQKLGTAEAKNYAEELLILHETFVQAARGEATYLDGPELFSALVEQGLMPYDATERMEVERMADCALQESSTPGCISFGEFLDLIRSLREVSLINANPRLLDYFQECDKDGNGRLSFAEASMIFSKLGMVPQCREDQDEMKSMLLKVDIDHSGDLDFQEFTHLVQHITEKLRSNERRRTNEVAQQLGFNEQQVAELREVFFNLDTHGLGDLGIDECRKTLTLLHLDMPSEQLKELFTSADKLRKGRLDLSSFFWFIEAMSRQEPKALIELKTFQAKPCKIALQDFLDAPNVLA